MKAGDILCGRDLIKFCSFGYKITQTMKFVTILLIIIAVYSCKKDDNTTVDNNNNTVVTPPDTQPSALIGSWQMDSAGPPNAYSQASIQVPPFSDSTILASQAFRSYLLITGQPQLISIGYDNWSAKNDTLRIYTLMNLSIPYYYHMTGNNLMLLSIVNHDTLEYYFHR